MVTNSSSPELYPAGHLAIGCNYWASHAGAAMWRDWQEDVVDADFKQLAAHGITHVRVFPLWSDFQPISLLQGYHGGPREVRHGEAPLAADADGQAGLDSVMLQRFACLCNRAEVHGLRLIVGLVTGWMSGRLFVPPALVGRNVITDPLALYWQSRYVHRFVQRFLDQRSIAAWDLGNECNCMAPVPGREAAFNWTALISRSIRAADTGRPILSGMHSLDPEGVLTGGWLIQDQAELCDYLTTHPYPLWTRHTSAEPIDALRTTHHATAETRFYSDIGGRPCIAEEIGTMGPMMGAAERAALFVRLNLFSLWANGGRAFLWWCAYDQHHLAAAPYDWIAIEAELGLFGVDRRPKPMVAEMQAFRRLLNHLPFRDLPARRVDAICVLTRGQDQWAVAYAAWILAAQARLGLRFAWAEDPLPEAELYLLPSLRGNHAVPRRCWQELLSRASAGATLYVSLDDAVLPCFKEIFGVEVSARRHRSKPSVVKLGEVTITIRTGHELYLVPLDGTKTLAADENGFPQLLRRSHGAGSVVLATWPLESEFTAASDDAEHSPLFSIYRALLPKLLRPADHPDARVAITVHGGRWVVLINHGTSPARGNMVLGPGWRLLRWLHGGPELAAGQTAIAEIGPS